MKQTESPFADNTPNNLQQQPTQPVAPQNQEQPAPEPSKPKQTDPKGTTIYIITISLVVVSLILMIVLAIHLLLRDEPEPVRGEIVFVPPAGFVQQNAVTGKQALSQPEQESVRNAFLTYVENTESGTRFQNNLSEMRVAVRQGNHVNATMVPSTSDGEQENFLAVFTNEGWKVVHSGAQAPPCDTLEKYAFPANVAESCV